MNITYKSIAEKESGKTFLLLQRVISPRWLTAGSLPSTLPCQVVLDKGILAWNFKFLKPKSTLILEI